MAQLGQTELHGIGYIMLESNLTRVIRVPKPRRRSTDVAHPGLVARLLRGHAKVDQVHQYLYVHLGLEVATRSGAGAGGGLGAGLIAFAGGQVRSGIDIVCDVLDFDRLLSGAHLVIAGEGRVDTSTVYNKAPIGVARRAKAHGIPVIALAGTLGRGYEEVYEHGINAVVCIVDRPMRIRDSIRRTYELLVGATERSLRLARLGLPED